MSHAQKSAKGAGGGGKPAPKAKKGAAGGKKPEDEREETLQAVVCICDSEILLRTDRHMLTHHRCLQTRSRPDSFLSQ